jgi:5-methylcytosine-specific restriction protein A
MPTRFCPRCRTGHEGRCPEAERLRAVADQKRGNFRERGYTSAWDKFRVLILRDEPFCRHCHQRGRMRPATLVDHIVPLAAGGELLDPENVQPLCVPCHAAKTQADMRKYPEAYRAPEESRGGRGHG